MRNWLIFLFVCSLSYSSLADTEEATPAAENAQESTQEQAEKEGAENTEAAAETDPQEYVLPNKNQQRDRVVKRHLQQQQRGDEFIQLNALGMPFSGMYLEQRTRNPQGAVLILPDNGEHGLWPAIAGPLRDTLPDVGWHTLSINLLATPSAPKARHEDLPATEQTSETSDSAKTEAKAEAKKYRLRSVEEYQQQMTARIDAGINKLMQQEPESIAIVATGYSAAWAALWLRHSTLSNNESPKISLIMINAIDAHYAPETLAETLPELQLPVLDLITPNALNNQSAQQKRKGYAYNSGNEEFLQVNINPVSLDNDLANEVVRRVRGWLKTRLPAAPKDEQEED